MKNPLDGQYRVSSTTNYNGPLEKKSDGITEIREGKTYRTDDAGCLWTSSFTILSDHEVEMVSIADPSNANSDFMLMRPNGTPTRKSVTYRSILRLSRKGEDQIQMSGQIEYGAEIIFLTMRKVQT